MKKFNLFYLIVFPIAYLLLQMSYNMNKSSASFFGFAENKETELSYKSPVFIKQIHVSPGQEVRKGDILMEVGQVNLDYKIKELDHQINQIQLLSTQKQASLKAEIELLEKEKEAKTLAILHKIQTLQSKQNLHQSFFEGLQSIDAQQIPFGQSTLHANIKELHGQLEQLTQTFDLEIGQKKTALLHINKPLNEQKNQLQTEQVFYSEEKELMQLYAPEDGLIGNILCKPGENVSSFSPLINFYEHNPTVVKGFVHENLIPEINVGDSLYVSSTLHPELVINGIVTGLGSRIVEIPERLRKLPEIKTYGREIIVQIPKKNPFLQKEKVMINTIETALSQDIISSLLFASSARGE